MSLAHPWEGEKKLTWKDSHLPRHTVMPPTAVADAAGAFFRNLRWIGVGVVVLFGCISLKLLVTRPIYESKLTYLVRGEGTSFPITTFDDSDSGRNTATESATDLQIGTEVELLSGLELHRVVLSSLRPIADTAEINRELGSFESRIKVFAIPKTTLISVSYAGSSPEEANAVLAALNKQYQLSRTRIHGSAKAYAFFESEANRYYQQLQIDQKTLAEFEVANKVTVLDEEKDVVVRRLSETQALFNESQAAQAETRQKLAKASSDRGHVPFRIGTQQRELPDQVSEEHFNSLLVDLQNKRLELLTKYHESDRHIQEVDGQIANTKAGLESARSSKAVEAQTDVNPLRQSIDAQLEQMELQTVGLRARQTSLAAQVRAYGEKLQDLNRVTAEHDDLVRSLKQNEANYDLYSKRREQARIDKTLDGNKIANVSLVSGPALVPSSKTRNLSAAISLYVAGTFVITGAGIILGLRSSTFHTPWEVETIANMPVLATIPFVPALGNPTETRAKGEDERELGRGRLWLESTRNAERMRKKTSPSPEVQVNAPDPQVPLTIMTVPSKLSGAYFPLIEKLRKLRPKVTGGGALFVVTSSISGEGVSHVVQGLNAELRRYTGKKVAVVTSPKMNEMADRAARGHPADVDSAYEQGGEDFIRTWFWNLRENHDFVIVDCGSMKESHAAVVLGQESDGVLLVVGAGDVTRIQLRGSLTALSLASVPVLGITMNKRAYPIPDRVYRML